MPSFITTTERDTLSCALGSINSYLNFVDEAEDRSDGIVSVPERVMRAWVTTINDVIESVDHRNKERLESQISYALSGSKRKSSSRNSIALSFTRIQLPSISNNNTPSIMSWTTTEKSLSTSPFGI